MGPFVLLALLSAATPWLLAVLTRSDPGPGVLPPVVSGSTPWPELHLQVTDAGRERLERERARLRALADG